MHTDTADEQASAHQLNQIRKYRTFYPREAQTKERAAIEGMPFQRGAGQGE